MNQELKQLKKVLLSIYIQEERTSSGKVGEDWKCENCGNLYDNYSIHEIHKGDGICLDCFSQFNKYDILSFVTDCLNNIIKDIEHEVKNG